MRLDGAGPGSYGELLTYLEQVIATNCTLRPEAFAADGEPRERQMARTVLHALLHRLGLRPGLAPADGNLATRPRVTATPGCPGEATLELPEYTYWDTQAGAAEVGIPAALLPGLRDALDEHLARPGEDAEATR